MTQIAPLSLADDAKIVVEVSPEELIKIKKVMNDSEGAKTKNIQKGLAGIRALFKCSQAQAFKIAHAEWFQPAKVQIGKLIAFDADLAWELAKKNSSS